MIGQNNSNTPFPLTYRILIIEDHALVRAAIRAILRQHPEMIIVSEAANGKDGIDTAKKLKPDVVLLDIELPDISGMQVAKKIMQSIPTKIIALTSQTDTVYLKQLSNLGVHGYLTKNCSPQELLEAIRSIQKPQPYLGLRVAEEISTTFLNQPSRSPFVALSQRELEILIMICHGEKTSIIAEKLFLSPKTINKHRQAFFKKLNVKNDIELAKLALQHGLIRL
jgi:two-component system invasion response regulator UvrY